MTKIDFINGAYTRARISGLTKLPTPSDIELALERLEDMAALWQGNNICTGYAFEDTPDPNTPHNVPRQYWSAYKSNLAMLLLSDFGKDPKPSLAAEAAGTFSAMSASTAKITETQYPGRQAVGSGNSIRYNRWSRYYQPVSVAPNECSSIGMVKDDVNDFTEHFDSYLKLAEVIASYTIVSSKPSSLTVSNDANTDSDVTYRATANEAGVFRVIITVTTDLGRIETRNINFTVISEEV